MDGPTQTQSVPCLVNKTPQVDRWLRAAHSPAALRVAHSTLLYVLCQQQHGTSQGQCASHHRPCPSPGPRSKRRQLPTTPLESQSPTSRDPHPGGLQHRLLPLLQLQTTALLLMAQRQADPPALPLPPPAPRQEDGPPTWFRWTVA